MGYMNFRKLIFIIVPMFCFIGLNLVALSQTEKSSPEGTVEAKPGLYEVIAQENLKSLSKIDLKSKNGLAASVEEWDKLGFAVKMQKEFDSQLNPPLQAKRRLIYSLLSEYEKNNPMAITNVLDEKTWQDLELLNGPKSDPTFYLASKLDRTVTEVGRVYLFKKIVQPNDDALLLESQQSVVKELVGNEKLFNELDAKLKELVIPENFVLSFWDTEDFFSFIMAQNKIKIPFDDKVKIVGDLSKYLNKSELVLESRGWIRSSFGRMADIFVLYAALALPIYAATGKSIIPWMPAEDYNKVAPYSVAGAFCLLFSKIAAERFSRGMSSSVATLKNWNILYYIIDDFRHSGIFLQLYYKKMSYVARFINNIKDMIKIAATNEILFKKLPAIKNFNETFDELVKKTKDLETLLDTLETDDFDQGDKASKYFTMSGRIMAAYYLMMDLKENFVPAMLAVGELDAQLSIAKLYKEFEAKRVHYCFPKYEQGFNTPSMKLENAWNPMVDENKVVPNSINLGQMFGATRNAIITGPNAGGKSTIMKSMIMCAILAQGLGIAPADSMTFTPFKKIITYLNITDDIAAGNSHFKAGVLRARDLDETVNAAKNSGVTLTAIDEVFNGTTHKEGQAAAYSLIKMLGVRDWNMCITNTHFPLVPHLEFETNVFTNYKVCVNYDQAGKIQYPYKLERGISNQIVTLRILQEDGFGDAFLSQAQQVLEMGEAH